jgi:hypothetical protein
MFKRLSKAIKGTPQPTRAAAQMSGEERARLLKIANGLTSERMAVILARGLAGGWRPEETYPRVAKSLGITFRPGDSIRDLIGKACGLSVSQVDRALVLFATGTLTLEQVDALVRAGGNV